MDKRDWRYDYDTDTNEQAPWKWWVVTDNIVVFKADLESDAEWLCTILNSLENEE